MDREIVISVSVRAVGYDKETSTLEIEFCDSSIYQFFEVPEEVYTGFLASMGLNHEKTDLMYFTKIHKRTVQTKDGAQAAIKSF